VKDHYAAYMLRIWLVGEGDGAVWRASLENPHTGECSVFVNSEALYAFLESLARNWPLSGTEPSEISASPDAATM